MKAELTHASGLRFDVAIRDHKFAIDGNREARHNSGPSPKELLLPAVAGCAGMDVASLMRKHGIEPRSFRIEAHAAAVDTDPKVFPQIDVLFYIDGENIPVDRLIEACDLSFSRLCGVSAMVDPGAPIFWTLVVNGEVEYRGGCRFP